MCGISILIRSSRSAMTDGTLNEMVRLSKHRGPDDEGTLFFGPDGLTQNAAPAPSWNVALGHTRLAVIDLSGAGRQPMRYGQSLWLTYNGEVYNYLELRSELQGLGWEFNTQSDSEVILAAYAAWGTNAFRRFRGMWALAILDTERQRVVFSRDRLGIKPLYIVRAADGLAVASEIKQFKALPNFQFKANHPAVAEYLKTGYENSRETLLVDVMPLQPGTWVSADVRDGRLTQPETFWEPNKISCTVTEPREAAVVLKEALRETLLLHLRSDVPVGISLSGGLDSGAIAAMVSKSLGRHDAHTFTCTFPGDRRDERRFAEAARESLTGSASFVTPSPVEFQAQLREFTWAHDEPVGGLSVYAAYRLAREMRATGVIVTLSGQGADEALGGYIQSYWKYLRDLAVGGHPFGAAGHLWGALMPSGNPELWRAAPGFIARLWSRRRQEDWVDGETAGGRDLLAESFAIPTENWRQFEMLQLFLPRLLKWEDRNSMASAVEGRYPFLDHAFIEAALSTSPETCYSRGWTKYSLRLAMDGTLPESVRMRKDKNGFEVPEERWLRSELRPLIENWLQQDRPLWGRVDRARVARYCHAYWSGRSLSSGLSAQTIFRLFSCDQWLDVFGVSW